MLCSLLAPVKSFRFGAVFLGSFGAVAPAGLARYAPALRHRYVL